MTSDKKRASDAPDDLDVGSHAADEPTAVWDESALRAAGLSDLLGKRDSEPPPPPATPPKQVSGDPSIVVDPNSIAPGPMDDAPRQATPVPQADAGESGLGWGATLAIAVLLGAIVYGLIRYLKG